MISGREAYAAYPALTPEPSGRLSWSDSLRLLKQPHMFLCALYAAAICFEQLVEIDVFKPYRLIGAALVMLMLIRGEYLFDRFARLALAFVGTGFFISVVQTTFGPGDFGVLFSTTARWCFNLATYIAIASLLKTRREIVLIAVVHAIVLLIAAYGISLEATREEIYGAARTARASGDFGNPANACVAMLFAGVVLITALRQRFPGTGSPLRMLNMSAILAICGYLLYTATLTGSRAGAGLLLIGFAVYFLLTLKHRAAVTIAVGLCVLTVLLLLADIDLSERNILAARIEKKGLDTARLYLWLSGLNAFADTLGIGVGMSRYMHLHKEYFAPYAYSSDIRWLDKDLTLHNDYVIALVEFGIVGFVLFVLLCVHLWKMSSSLRDPNLRAIAIAVLTGMALNGLTHAGFPYFIVWFYFALLSALISVQQRSLPRRRAASDGKIRPTRTPARPLDNRVKLLR